MGTVLPRYFQTSVDTLLETTKDDCTDYLTPHDVVEAYSTLASRIRARIHSLIKEGDNSPALEPFRTHSVQITQCLQRDISRAFDAPLPDRVSSISFGVYSAGSLGVVAITEADVQAARDNALLCHHALRLVSNIFRFPILYNRFSMSSLKSLLEEVLAIASSTSLPSYNQQKTHTLALWVLQTQLLPAQIILLKKAEIASLLKDAIEGTKRKENKTENRAHGLEATQAILMNNPLEFLDILAPLLSSILPHLVSSHSPLRNKALLVLNAFVHAKITAPPGRGIEHAIAQSVGAFVSHQASIKTEDSLKKVLEGALTNEGLEKGCSAAWALGVLSSLIVLSDQYLFRNPRSLRLVLPCLGLALTHKRSAIRTLQPVVWKGLVWAFGRLPSSETTTEKLMDAKGKGKARESGEEVKMGLKSRALRVVMQELGGGIGLDLVAALLNVRNSSLSSTEGSFDAVAEALFVVKALLENEDETRFNEGLSLLGRLLGGVEESSSPDRKAARTYTGKETWELSKILSLGPFSSSRIFELPRWSDLSKAVSILLTGKGLEASEVRKLGEAEILQNWMVLVELWVLSVRRGSNGNLGVCRLENEITHTWQSLLLAQASLTQGRSHLTANETVAPQIATTLSNFLSQSFLSSSVDSQLSALNLVRRLWNVLRNVFTTSWLKDSADRVLCTLLKSPSSGLRLAFREGGLEGTMLEVWNRLFNDLVKVGFPEIFDAVHAKVKDPKRQLWCILARIWASVGVEEGGQNDWQVASEMLIVPVKSMWDLAEYEVEAWDNLLRCVISIAGSESKEPVDVVEHLLEAMEEKDLTCLQSSPQLVLIIITHLNLFNVNQIPSFVPSFISDSLSSLYPPPTTYHNLSLEIIRAVGDVIASTHQSLVPTLLSLLQPGLYLWLVDKKDALEDEEYNHFVIPLYCDALKSLMALSPSLKLLNDLSPFLSAVFVHHIPPPGLGPGAFERFWRATYHGSDTFKQAYPEEIMLCLKAFDDAFGGSLAAGLSESMTQSQMQIQPQTPSVLAKSVVPDSQESHTEADSRSRGFRLDGERSSRLCTSTRDAKNAANTIVTAETTPNKISSPLDSEHARKSTSHYKSVLRTSDGRRNPLGSGGVPREKLVGNHGDGHRVGSFMSDLKEDQERRPRILLTNSGAGGMEVAGPSTPTRKVPSTGLRPPPIVEIDLKGRLPRVTKRPTAQEDSNPQKRHKPDTKDNGGDSGPKTSGKRVKPFKPPSGEPESEPASEPIVRRAVVPSSNEMRAASQPIATRKRKSIFDYVEVPPIPAQPRKRRRIGLASPLNPELIEAPPKHRPIASTTSGIRAGSIRDGRARTAPILFQTLTSPLPSPVQRARTTPRQLDALQNAFSAVANDASQLPSEELVEATRLVNQIGTVLNEQVIRRLNAKR